MFMKALIDAPALEMMGLGNLMLTPEAVEDRRSLDEQLNSILTNQSIVSGLHWPNLRLGPRDILLGLPLDGLKFQGLFHSFAGS
ncbi:MAG: hypothetical protein AB7G93_09035 [Bdellovibrionales bacterium]